MVTIARGRHAHLAAQHRSLAAQERIPDRYVVVAMGDPLIRPVVRDGLRREVVAVDVAPEAGARLPLAHARNRGVAAALGAGADTVVCLDVDCLAGAGLVQAYEDAVREEPEVVWSGPVTYLAPGADHAPGALAGQDAPHPARPAPAPGERRSGADPRLFWSLSFALSGEAWRRSGGFDEAYTGYGAEDTDFGFRVERAGLGLGWVGSARSYHQHHPTQDPPVQHLEDILRNARTFHDRWGEWPMPGWLEAFARLGLVERTDDGWRRAEV